MTDAAHWYYRFRGFETWIRAMDAGQAAALLDDPGPGWVDVRLMTWSEKRAADRGPVNPPADGMGPWMLIVEAER